MTLLFDAIHEVLKMDLSDDAVKALAAAVESWLEEPRRKEFAVVADKTTKSSVNLWAKARDMVRDIRNVSVIDEVRQSLLQLETQLAAVKDLEGEVLLQPVHRNAIRAMRPQIKADIARAPNETLRKQASEMDDKLFRVEKRLQVEEVKANGTVLKAVLTLTMMCLEEICTLGARASHLSAA